MSSVTRSSRRRRARRDLIRLGVVLTSMAAFLVALLVVGTVLLQRSMTADVSAVAPGAEHPEATQTLGPDPALPVGLPVELLGGPIHYVALGDSYSAGPGIPPQLQQSAVCGRSGNNYPAYLADWFEVASYRDVTCSGATTFDIVDPKQTASGQVPPQADGLSRDTDLVTLGLGVNNIGIYPNLIVRCSQLAQLDPSPGTCRRHDETSGVASLAQAAGQIEDQLLVTIEEVRRRAPTAAVVLIGYPQIFPRSGTCAQLPFSTADAAWAADVLDAVNASLRSAAEQERVRFVDLGAGHDICSSDPWMAGAAPGGSVAPWHPYQSGMRAMAAAVYLQLTGTAAPAGAGDAAPSRDAIAAGLVS